MVGDGHDILLAMPFLPQNQDCGWLVWEMIIETNSKPFTPLLRLSHPFHLWDAAHHLSKMINISYEQPETN